MVVRLQPEGETRTFDRVNTALQLLNRLGLLPTMALVIRNGGLLTPDVRIRPGDELEVRRVTSSG
ncbi:MAG: hypothetical protein H0S85_13675 [Desulfovibrionaceae bacterium]|nr:hypothetical protein [Desulfovibrionaceae bacterium]